MSVGTRLPWPSGRIWRSLMADIRERDRECFDGDLE
jgi:hypothetical protein